MWQCLQCWPCMQETGILVAGLPAGVMLCNAQWYERVVTMGQLSHFAHRFSYLTFRGAIAVSFLKLIYNYCDLQLLHHFFFATRVHGVNDEIKFHWMSAGDVVIVIYIYIFLYS